MFARHIYARELRAALAARPPQIAAQTPRAREVNARQVFPSAAHAHPADNVVLALALTECAALPPVAVGATSVADLTGNASHVEPALAVAARAFARAEERQLRCDCCA